MKEERPDERLLMSGPAKKWWCLGKTGTNGKGKRIRQTRNRVLNVKGKEWELLRMTPRFLAWPAWEMMSPLMAMRKSVGETGLVGKAITYHLFSKSFNWNANYVNPLQSVNNYCNTIVNVYFVKNWQFHLMQIYIYIIKEIQMILRLPMFIEF